MLGGNPLGHEYSDTKPARVDLEKVVKDCFELICADGHDVDITDGELDEIMEGGEPSKLKIPPHVPSAASCTTHASRSRDSPLTPPAPAPRRDRTLPCHHRAQPSYTTRVC